MFSKIFLFYSSIKSPYNVESLIFSHRDYEFPFGFVRSIDFVHWGNRKLNCLFFCNRSLLVIRICSSQVAFLRVQSPSCLCRWNIVVAVNMMFTSGRSFISMHSIQQQPLFCFLKNIFPTWSDSSPSAHLPWFRVVRFTDKCAIFLRHCKSPSTSLCFFDRRRNFTSLFFQNFINSPSCFSRFLRWEWQVEFRTAFISTVIHQCPC